jgi:AraC-like DNA-binding protein
MQFLGAYALIYILKGSGVFRNEAGYESTFVPGDALLLFPELGHLYGATSEDGLEEIFITFKGPVFDLWKRAGLLDPRHPQFHLEPIPLWLEKLKEIIAVTPANSVEALQPVSGLCALLSQALIARSTLQEVIDEPAWLSQARTMLGSDFQRTIGGVEVAHQIGVSYDVFRHQFRRQTGLSPARYRMNQRIAAACDLLLHSSLNIRQISELLGFNTEFHFSQRFKEFKGVSPSKFRGRGS